MPRKRELQGSPVEIDAAAGEVFQQRHFLIVKLRMDNGQWERHLDAETEAEARAYIAEQRRRYPSIPQDDWGVFAGELTRIELRLG